MENRHSIEGRPVLPLIADVKKPDSFKALPSMITKVDDCVRWRGAKLRNHQVPRIIPVPPLANFTTHQVHKPRTSKCKGVRKDIRDHAMGFKAFQPFLPKSDH